MRNFTKNSKFTHINGHEEAKRKILKAWNTQQIIADALKMDQSIVSRSIKNMQNGQLSILHKNYENAQFLCKAGKSRNMHLNAHKSP